MFDNIKKLCEINGISGREDRVAEEILAQAKPYADDLYRDNLGSVIAFKKGKQTPKNKLMFCAHMDEVGFLITDITDDGYLRFSPLGITPKVILGRQVRVGEQDIPGVIATKAIHMYEEDEFKASLKHPEKWLIDIGADSREEAEKFVSLGDSAHFVGDYTEYGDRMVVAKAIDDRAGCAILLELMKTELEFDTYFVFTVQEEIGGRGARAATFAVDPDIAVVVESTASGDVSGVTGSERVTVVGEGAVITYMDNGMIYDRELYRLGFELAEKAGVKCQTKTKIAGGNDAGVIHTSRGGVRCAAVSIPSRYIHSASDAACKADIEAVYAVVKGYADTAGNL